MTKTNAPNRLVHEKSPYLIQHAHNPVDWFPWGEEAFNKAHKENKPVFLSIGYSTCHWCHVKAHESFEDASIANILNEKFVSIKVDKEERPDIDVTYMNVCQAFTGSGGWPMSILMTPNQKPFFAGTYFPKQAFADLLSKVDMLWKTNKNELIKSGDEVVDALNDVSYNAGNISSDLILAAVDDFKSSFDKTYGGFGYAPKFPSPHQFLFLMNYYENSNDKYALDMVEKTLLQMYKGGIFDHIGFGFSRYSTDKYFLAPHFEKMLYDNALLMISYIKAYDITKNEFYKEVATKTAAYILREMTSDDGGFFSAQDADSDGVEGKYYVFDYDEIITLLGDDTGKKFNEYYGITKRGNFEGKSIPNLLNNTELNDSFEEYLPKIYEYRKSRTKLHLDDKILTSWNGLMISAFAMMYRVLGDKNYLDAAKKACDFIDKNLSDDNMLYVSFRDGKKGSKGFLDDYAFYIFALIEMYEASAEQKFLDRAVALCNKAVSEFYDTKNGGFYLYGTENEKLILRPKELYDGAMPSGNSVMSYNLVKLTQITEDKDLENLAQKQLQFTASNSKSYPMGYSFNLLALSMFLNPPVHIVCALKGVHQRFPLNAVVRIIHGDTKEYPLINNKTTYYVCKNKNCLPPTNNLEGKY